MDSTIAADATDDSSQPNTLEQFREKWQNELSTARTNTLPNSQNNEANSEFASEAEAFFMEGVALERSGEVFEAMQMYRKAVHLDSEIEFKMYDKTKANTRKQSDGNTESVRNIDATASEELAAEHLTEDLILRFTAAMNVDDSTTFAEPSTDDIVISDNSLHLMSLPIDVLAYILRWVVSSNLDLRSLEQCSLVCKAFYLCSRETQIWRLACQKVWGHKAGELQQHGFASWRHMYIERPRVWLNGCYISRTTYYRYGERSFQDQFYRPVHLIKYFRYIRFFSNGSVIVMTSADDPASVVGRLQNFKHRTDLLRGTYKYSEDMVTLFVKKSSVKAPTNDRCRDPTFGLHFVISSGRRKKIPQLEWRKYTIIQKGSKGEERCSDFDLTPNGYPPLLFSRVKSYDAVSYQCL